MQPVLWNQPSEWLRSGDIATFPWTFSPSVTTSASGHGASLPCGAVAVLTYTPMNGELLSTLHHLLSGSAPSAVPHVGALPSSVAECSTQPWSAHC